MVVCRRIELQVLIMWNGLKVYVFSIDAEDQYGYLNL